jgi:hypothetical protein
LTQAALGIIGNRVQVIYTISGRTAGTLTFKAGTTVGTARSTNATFTEDLDVAGNTTLTFAADAAFDGTIVISSVTNLSQTSWAPTAGALGANYAQAVAAQQAYLSTLGGKSCLIGADDNADSDVAKSNYRFLHDGTGGTIACWIYPTNTGVMADTRRTNAVGRPGMQFYLVDATHAGCQVDDNLGNIRVNANGAGISLNAWNKVIFRLSTTAFSLRVNGVETDSGAPSGALYSGDPYRALAVMGLAGGSPIAPFRGGMAEMLTAQRYLTDAECVNLEAYWT